MLPKSLLFVRNYANILIKTRYRLNNIADDVFLILHCFAQTQNTPQTYKSPWTPDNRGSL
jgi:hypothetical protein